jgi:hypothetical protein
LGHLDILPAEQDCFVVALLAMTGYISFRIAIVELVKRMLDLQKQLADARVPQAQTLLQRQIEATDRQIDRPDY